MCTQVISHFFLVLPQHNTFQAILVNDGLRSFALYAYNENSIQWSVPATRDPRANFGNAVVGFTAPNHYFSDPRSASSSIDSIDNYPDSKNKDLLPQPCTYGAMYVFKLYDAVDITGSQVQCKQWSLAEPDPMTWTKYLPPCPCYLDQAESDGDFREVFHKSSTARCFQSVFPTELGSGENQIIFEHQAKAKLSQILFIFGSVSHPKHIFRRHFAL